MLFLEWLVPREHTMLPLLEKDLAQRNLAGTASAIGPETLASREESRLRRIDHILLKKSLSLFYFCKGKEFITGNADFRNLMDDQIALLLNLQVDADFLRDAGLKIADLASKGIPDLRTNTKHLGPCRDAIYAQHDRRRAQRRDA